MWAPLTCAATCCAYCTCEACKTALNGIGRSSARIAYVGLFALSLILAWMVRDYAEPVMHYVSCKQAVLSSHGDSVELPVATAGAPRKLHQVFSRRVSFAEG